LLLRFGTLVIGTSPGNNDRTVEERGDISILH
jgi:hypothetical protein